MLSRLAHRLLGNTDGKLHRFSDANVSCDIHCNSFSLFSAMLHKLCDLVFRLQTYWSVCVLTFCTMYPSGITLYLSFSAPVVFFFWDYYCRYFASPAKCWYLWLFIPLIYFCLPCSGAKKCQVCLCSLHFAMFLFILCYSSLYLVTASLQQQRPNFLSGVIKSFVLSYLTRTTGPHIQCSISPHTHTYCICTVCPTWYSCVI